MVDKEIRTMNTDDQQGTHELSEELCGNEAVSGPGVQQKRTDDKYTVTGVILK